MCNRRPTPASRQAAIDLARQFHVGLAKTAPAGLVGLGVAGGGLVQDAHQVDGRLHAAEQGAQGGRIVDIRLDDLDAGQDQEILGVFPAAGGNAHPEAPGGEQGDEMVADETATAKNADCLDGHDDPGGL
jgi:hypothetical protein